MNLFMRPKYTRVIESFIKIKKKKLKELILISFIADYFSSDTHWIYSEERLDSLAANWEVLNDTKYILYKDRRVGKFIDYNKEIFWLYEILKTENSFNQKDYLDFWRNKIRIYNRYIDKIFENIETKDMLSEDFESRHLAVVSRVVPLLLVSLSENDFLEKVKKLVISKYDSNETLAITNFFAKLLLNVIEGKNIKDSIAFLKEFYDSKTQYYINIAISSKEENTSEVIQNFASLCDFVGIFPSVIHLLYKYDDLNEMLIENAKAGGDYNTRAMIASTIYLAQPNKSLIDVPSSWLNIKADIV